LLRFENVHKTYKTGTDALRGVSFIIEDGEFVFVIGKSGSGKSTLMKCITREERPTEGMVLIDRFNISKMSRALIPYLRRQIGIIYQDFRLIETKTVAENIAFAGEIIGVPKKRLNQMVDIVLGSVGLRDKAQSMPMELSGGEQQRVAIARAMLNSPKMIVADEPTGNLDPETSESIMALLLEINRTGTTVIVCTHDSNMVDRMQKRVIEVEDGLIVRDEKASGYTAVVEPEKPALPKNMQDEFDPDDSDDQESNKPLPEFPPNRGEDEK
jgi:cell division ATP-binding protein FtsE